MSREGSTSRSGSTNSSSSQLSFFQDNVTDLTLFGSAAPTFIRTGTVVRRANSIPFRKDRIESTSSTEDDDATPLDKFRTDLTQYRHSLAAIHERKSGRNSGSSDSAKLTHRTFISMETSSDNTDYLPISSITERDREDKALVMSPSSSSYLSWIESVNSGNFDSAVSTAPGPAQDIDNKVGEWNNFWLNYSNARLRHLSTDPTFSSDGERTADDTWEEHNKSQGSTQRDVTDKNSVECVMLTLEEVNETMRCSQRITEILHNAMKRSEVDESSTESYYSQQPSGKTSLKEDIASVKATNRERSVSCVDQQSIQKQQKQLLDTTQQSSSTSCINAILSTGVADMLKKVISKRREVITSDSDTRSTTRSSFSEWTGR